MTEQIDSQLRTTARTVIENVKGQRIPVTPPDYVDDAKIRLTENSRKVLERRYLRRDVDGTLLETPAGMFYRVASHIAQVEAQYGGDVDAVTRTFYDLLTDFRFFPNSPTFTGAGTPLGQLAACFVIPIADDMGKSSDGIFSSLRVAALIQQTGGGNGFSFSRLRPKNDIVHTSAGRATGPVGFLRVYDQAFGEIAQGGSRRGANMGVLRVDHPDIEEFIECKAEEGKITNFNISVAITDEFMQAVKDDTDFHLRNPRDGKVWKTVRARDLFAKIIRHAHHNGEPGALFIDAANRSNPVPHLYELEATNPCVTGDTPVATPGGWRRVDEIQPGDSILTVDGVGVVATVEVHNNMPVYLVAFADGGSVRATASHQFHVLDPESGAFVPTRLDHLRPGDQVRVLRPYPLELPALEMGVGQEREQPTTVQLRAEETLARIVNITFAGIDTVYDLYEPETDTWITAGYVSRGCGEQWLGPYENCCLGSINLAQHVTTDDQGKPVVDWELLRRTVRESTHFLDNVVSANAYVPAVPEVAEAAYRARRIGLGIMGLGDMMFKLGIRYGSEAGQEFAAQIMEFIRYHCMQKSIELAQERGPFPAFKGSIYDPEAEPGRGMAWQPPRPLQPYRHDWQRPPLDWNEIVAGIQRHGIRNAAQTTVAPTGTIATVCGCEGYGCEPVFALGYIRHFKDGDRDVELNYTSPLFEEALNQTDLSPEAKERIKQHVAVYGSCQNLPEVPEHIRHTFVVSSDITAEEHVRMQAAIQAFVDNSISKTINFPEHATEEDVAKAYMLAWELGCKGLTVYVTGSRQEVVLETKATKARKEDGPATAEGQPATVSSSQAPVPYANGAQAPASAAGDVKPIMTKRPRPKTLHGVTYRKETPLGTAYITVNNDERNEPFEVFLNVGKAGSEVSAVSEALGRLISLVLRMPASLPPSERLRWVMDELAGIGGGRPLGFGANRVRSLPDGVAQVLAEHLSEHPPAREEFQLAEQLALPIAQRPIGDICPDCGEAAFLNVEGCRKCHVCGYSEC